MSRARKEDSHGRIYRDLVRVLASMSRLLPIDESGRGQEGKEGPIGRCADACFTRLVIDFETVFEDVEIVDDELAKRISQILEI
jgi:hypothetical protein